MQGKLSFIKLEKVILRNFSLYKKNGKVYEVNEDINQGVYCLAGANGLGKTTFLNTLNYGLTGIVLEPEKEVFSPNEIVKSNHDYTERYFKGRITKKSEDLAEIEILFKVKEKFFRIIRGFTNRQELRLLEVFTVDKAKKVACVDTKKLSPLELNELYEKEVANEVGFTSFEYFMFYQLYILTFDENRRMIFWDDRASSNALAVAFNSDPRDAENLSDLIRKMEKHESNGRNARWQATQANNKIKELTGNIKGKKGVNTVKLESEFKKLNKEFEKKEKVFNNLKIEYDSMLKKQSHLNSEIMLLKMEHSKLFSRYSKPRSKLTENTNVKMSLKKQECCLCGSHGSYIVENIEKSIKEDACPLCDTAINENVSAEQGKLLKAIQANDEKISTKNDALESLIQEIVSKQGSIEKAEFEFNSIKEKLEEFENEYPDYAFGTTGNKKSDSLIGQYRKQFELADKEAKEEYAKRDKLKPQHEKLLGKIEKAYKEAKTVFVPTFKKLAHSFIGLDLNIQLNRGQKGIKLVLELQQSARTESFQLSESQRFFLDIALRMSLAIFLSEKKSGATMLIDTPEGSLDIAYESRVGNMFAEFTTYYHQNIFMTANINASQLLISLAEKCGKDTMKFRRMLDWTDLSEIQKDGEKYFKAVYSNIETALAKKK